MKGKIIYTGKPFPLLRLRTLHNCLKTDLRDPLPQKLFDNNTTTAENVMLRTVQQGFNFTGLEAVISPFIKCIQHLPAVEGHP